MTALNLYFLRHGETIYSQTGKYCGDLDPELTTVGVQMAEAFATAYCSLPWTAIFCSPMKRTIATARPLCDAIGIEMQLQDGLREISYGKWEEQTVESVKQNYQDDYLRWLAEPAWNSPTGGETAVQVATRATSVIAEIVKNYSTGNILIVSHKATLRIILCSLLGIDLGRYRDRLNLLVASVSIVKFDLHGPLLQVLGDRYHLPDSLRNLPGT